MEQIIDQHFALASIPRLDCGACGFRHCDEFISAVENSKTPVSHCPHIPQPTPAKDRTEMIHHRNNGLIGEKMGWKDHLKRDFDFILDCFDNEPGPRETVLPYNPLLTKELNVKKGDIMIGRPMGMSCGCPITHCGIVTDADHRNGVINWCVTGPLRPRSSQFIDIGYYIAQGYEGIVREWKSEIELGRRYWFMPRRCMLQWRHSGLINAMTRLPDGSYKIRIEGLFIG